MLFAAASLVIGSITASCASAPPSQETTATSGSPTERIEPYRPHVGRQRPVIAIVGVNSGAELIDYIIPFGILKQADVGEIVTVATEPGPMTMRPALRIQPEDSVAAFDARFPEGADYVVVPAVVRRDDPVLLAWLKSQSAKGATLVSICDGALVLANAGVLNGRRATAHWATADYRRKTFPDVHWVDNRRYVADGKVVSSAGISAAIPTSLALVEAISGHDRAASVARDLGVLDWSSAHDSQVFRPKLGRNLLAFAETEYLNGWFHRRQSIGLPVSAGVNEIALAMAAEGFSRTGRAKAYAIARTQTPIKTLHGLTLLPDLAALQPIDRMVAIPVGKPAQALDGMLDDITRFYGRPTAYGVALDLEYPGFHG
jgi:putative intracellular protease/amidase